MKFSPCKDQCTFEGTHCQGCGRARQEILDTKKLVVSIASFIQGHEYENKEEFLTAINKNVLKRLEKTA